eukprot:SAG11_NODE_1068_length_5979_cov_9.282653_6_plen_59_part_00
MLSQAMNIVCLARQGGHRISVVTLPLASSTETVRHFLTSGVISFGSWDILWRISGGYA